MELLQSMFLENWCKPVQEWCKREHMIFTGHFLHEDSLVSQAVMQGSLMRAPYTMRTRKLKSDFELFPHTASNAPKPNFQRLETHVRGQEYPSADKDCSFRHGRGAASIALKL